MLGCEGLGHLAWKDPRPLNSWKVSWFGEEEVGGGCCWWHRSRPPEQMFLARGSGRALQTTPESFKFVHHEGFHQILKGAQDPGKES